MPSFYDLIQDAISICTVHQNQKETYYEIESQAFCCQYCQCQNKQIKSATQNQSRILSNKIHFSLKQILENPILLMLKQTSFLSSFNSQNNSKYHFKEFLKILTEMDSFIKNKKNSHQLFKQLLTSIKLQVNTKIDSIIQKIDQNWTVLKEVQSETNYLKRIDKEYSNQFQDTFQRNFQNGTNEQLKNILRKYSVQNQNPFRTISQKVTEISRKINTLTQINWESISSLVNRILDPYLWRNQNLFFVANENSLQTHVEKNIILPNSQPYQLNFKSSISQVTSLDLMNTQNSVKNKKYSTIFLTYSEQKISLLKQNESHQFQQIDTFKESKFNFCDMMFQLPRKMLMAISYESIKFYSYQFNAISFISQITKIKGCSQILVLQNYCVILAIGKLYKINYFQLERWNYLKIDDFCTLMKEQIVTQIMYLFKNGKKLQNEILVKIENTCNYTQRQIMLQIY